MQFHLWSAFHFIAIIAPFIVVATLLLLTRKSSQKTNQIIGIILSILGILILLLRNINLELQNNWAFLPDAIPLQLCHFANFFFLFAFIFRSKVLYSYGFTINLPAAILALIFAGGVEQYATIISFHGLAYFVGHLLLIVMPIFALVKGMFYLNIKTIVLTSTLTVIMFLLANPLCNLMNRVDLPEYEKANYFFAVKPNPGFPMTTLFALGNERILGGWYHINIIYLMAICLLGVIIIVALYFIYLLATKLFKLPQAKSQQFRRNKGDYLIS
ncbi:MAG: YwaF family protein [Acholeplasmatales bacterium]|nr:YwaF family protein [Acholeplasmatales bacterium]